MKPGDCVRVRRQSSPTDSWFHGWSPSDDILGKKYVVGKVRWWSNMVAMANGEEIHVSFLEPWEEGSQWDGYKWVAYDLSNVAVCLAGVAQ